MLGADTLLAIFVSLTLVVKGIDGTTFAHLGHWTITKHHAMATIGPVLAIIESVLASHALFDEPLLGNAVEIIVATVGITISGNLTGAGTGQLTWSVPDVILGFLFSGGVLGGSQGEESE